MEQTDYLMVLKEKPHGPLVATVELNNCPVHFEVDTGASRRVIGRGGVFYQTTSCSPRFLHLC